MPRFEIINVKYYDTQLGLHKGDVVTASFSQIHNKIMICRLPKRLHGKGHGSNGNYWCFTHYDLKRLPDETIGEDQS